MPKITTVSFDRDDTIWCIQPVMDSVEERLLPLLRPYASEDDIQARLRVAEARHGPRLERGVNGFVLMLIELAIEVSRGAIGAQDIRRIVRFADDIAARPVALVEGARATLSALALEYTLILHVVGDLPELELRIERSGLADLFDHVRIVSRKDDRTFSRMLGQCGVSPGQLVTVGRSLATDILPALTRGAYAIHLDDGSGTALPGQPLRYRSARRISDVPQIIGRINGEAS